MSVIDALLTATQANAEAAKVAASSGGGSRPDSAVNYAQAAKIFVEAAHLLEISGLDRETVAS